MGATSPSNHVALLESLEPRLLLSHSVLTTTALTGVTGGVTVDYAAFPLEAYVGNPWSSWGKGVVASNGNVYNTIGDHGPSDAKNLTGNAFVFEYNP